jgi:hypothetical protein
MVKLVQCIRRRQDRTIDEFRDFCEGYGAKLRDVALALGAVQVSLSIRLEVELNEQLRLSRDTMEAFDAVAEVSWPHGYQLAEKSTRESIAASIADLRRFQEEFVDLPNSSFFFTLDSVLFDRRHPPAAR